MRRTPKRAVLKTWVGNRQNPQLVNCLESPINAEITEQLKLLPGGDQVSAVELHISKTHYIALGGSVTEGFYARYHEFSRAGEWETVRDDLSLESAANLVACYRDQTDDWKQLVQWKRRSITDELQQQRHDHEARKIALSVTKVIGFLIGFLRGGRKSSRKSRRK
jgi:hypothetical protein